MFRHIFDSHTHYTDDRFNDDRHALLAALPRQGIACAVTCADDLNDARDCLDLAARYDYIYAACGIHPHKAEEAPPDAILLLKELAQSKKCVAIGEIGLDYHYDLSPRETQRTIFERQLELANVLRLPVIVHDREAHADTLALLRKHKPRGVVHCYSGSLETAYDLLGLGLYLGFGGAVTFKNAIKPLEIACAIPLDRLLLETDAPYMTPVPCRGKRCDSAHIAYTARKIAQGRGLDAQELIDRCNNNARKLFDISDDLC
ncbi:MAG: TatD family hydrolase [Oscillospiraceae bacterium]|jgi:TatD DNase family protein|nr:TatD family hydrolase [Oscillospiraceae bacterium]